MNKTHNPVNLLADAANRISFLDVMILAVR